jgi:hypothetical protein
MVSMMLARNNFSGPVPTALYDMPLVTYLDVSSNQLTGELKTGISLLVYLTQLDASYNKLTGEVGYGLFFLPQISRLNLAGNNFSGTISPDLGLAYNLRDFILVNNTGIIGRLPDEAGGLSQLSRLAVQGTGLSCVPDDIAQAQAEARAAGRPMRPYKCPPGQQLPCFLEFEPFDVPRSDESRMACLPLKRRTLDDMRAACPPAALPAQDAGPDALGQQWDLPPSYYQYQGCRCLSGFRGEWTEDGTVLSCYKDDRVPLPAWTWALVALGGVLLVFAGALLMLGSRWALFRVRWLREAELKRKRAMGPPRDGAAVTVVVTDIEGYSSAWWCLVFFWGGKGGGECVPVPTLFVHIRHTKTRHKPTPHPSLDNTKIKTGLMKANPSMTTRALSMHNAVLRKAAHDQAGYVIEQEVRFVLCDLFS